MFIAHFQPIAEARPESRCPGPRREEAAGRSQPREDEQSLTFAPATDRRSRAIAHGRESAPAAAARRRREPVVREARQEAADRDAAFEPRQRHADALVEPGAEGEVPVRRARDVEPVGVGEPRRVAVGGADAERARACAARARRRRSSVAHVVMRLPSWFELSKRRNSSTAVRTSAGLGEQARAARRASRAARRGRCRSGWSSSRGRR